MLRSKHTPRCMSASKQDPFPFWTIANAGQGQESQATPMLTRPSAVKCSSKTKETGRRTCEKENRMVHQGPCILLKVMAAPEY